ncbi:Estrogen receptor [Ranunculus cassubicifolius]
METLQRDLERLNLKKVDIPSPSSEEKMEQNVVITPVLRHMLMRQNSNAMKMNCLCSPTTHAGSFRCRLHRSPSLQRTKSMSAASPRTRGPTPKAADVVDAS